MEVAGLIQPVHLERRLPRDRVQAPLVRWFHPNGLDNRVPAGHSAEFASLLESPL